MKKILTIALLAMAASAAFADTTNTTSVVSTDSKAVASSNGGTQGQQQGISGSGNSSAGVTGSGNSSAGVAGSGNGTATNQGVAASNTNNFTSPANTTAAIDQNVHGTQTIRNTPSVSGPNLTSSNDTCMGAASGSINAPGIGLSLGKTYTDDNCVMLKNSRELWNMGMKGAAMALMCTDAKNREALELTGYECPQTTKARNGNVALQRSIQPTQAEYTDPIVRARLGLAPLASN